jgi:MFS family permease
VTTLAWLGSALPRIPVGYLLTRVERHQVIVGAGVVLTGAAAFTALAPSFEFVLVGAFLMGLSSGAYFIAGNPLVSELFPDRVGRALGFHGTAAQLAAVGAPLAVTGVLLVGDWRLTFALIAAVAGLTTLAIAVVSRRAELPDAGREDRDLLGAARAQWRIVLTGVAVVGTVGFLWNGLFNFYVRYLVAAKGLDPATGNLLLTALFAAGVPAFLVAGRLADRFPNVPLLLSVVGGFVASVVLLTAVQGLVPLLLVSALTGYVVHSLFPVADTYLLASLPDDNRASAYTAYSAMMMVVQATGGLAVGTLVDAGWGYDRAFLSMAAAVGCVLVGLVALYALGRLPAGRVPGERAGTETGTGTGETT